jgi:putative membrane protein
MRLILRLLINALALWLTTLIVAGVRVTPYLLVAAIFGVVNGVIGNLIRIVAFPIYLLTLGLVSLLVNGLLLLLASWLSTTILGFGLSVDTFWWGVLGAFVLGFMSWLIGILLRPLTGTSR